MSEPFKPGDVVRTIVPHRVIKSVDPAHAIDRFLHFEDGTLGRPQNYELVEPSIPVSKIREVCERHKASYTNVNLQMVVALLRAELLKEST